MGLRSGAQAGRWLSILDRLASSARGLSIGELAAELNCTPRTIYRDLEALQRRLGAPLVQESDEDEGTPRWKMMDGTRWRVRLEVTAPELLGLLAAERVGSPLAGTAYGSGLATLAAKVRARLGEQGKIGAEADADAFQTPPPDRVYSARAGVVDALRRAIRDRASVELRYFSLRAGEVSLRQVDPYLLRFVDGALYLVGRCRRRDETRTFLVDRIRSLDATGERFDVPDFDAEEYGRNCFRAEHGEPVTVTIRFTKAIAPLVRERTWHPTQSLVELPGGDVGLTLRTGGLAEVKRWVMGFGPAARVVGPPELALAVRAEAERIAALYEEGAASGEWRVPAEAVMHRDAVSASRSSGEPRSIDHRPDAD